ncbi:MAG: chorismate mutase [Alphaproteobacteria bacterium]|nr:chorismate mutase [Alphaproteobacteria bacterium]
MPSLDELRAEIDTIDRQLHDLLVRRVAIGREMARAKSSDPAPPYRPAREAQVMRRLLQRNRPPLATGVLDTVWRAIMSANLNQQEPITALLYAPDPGTRDLARDYCAGATRIDVVETAAAALDPDARATMRILPMITGDVPDRWWPLLFAGPAPAPSLQVVARLPFFEPEAPGCEALVVAAQPPEASGDDRTLFAIAGSPPHDGELLDSWNDACAWHVVQFDGFHDQPPAIPRSAPWHRLGVYATPVRN